MRLTELVKKLEKIKEKGYIPSLRKGPTGIGHIAESELELNETNIAIPDIGGRVEMKASRRNVNSLITLFTFNRAVWKISQKEIVNKYGYLDNNGRVALYNVVNTRAANTQGFFLISDPKKHLVISRNKNETENVAEWSTYVIAGKFMTKLDRLLLIFADNKIENDIEYFHFNEAYLLENPTPERFLEAFKKNELIIDLRMHLKPGGGVRNHGTAFRIDEKSLKDLYGKQRRLI